MGADPCDSAGPVWVEEHDVLVAGSGGGGVAGAYTAAREGLDVLLVEATDKFGGTTAYSGGGGVWFPCNPVLVRAGTDATGPNAGLKPETVDGAEAGLDWRPVDGMRVGLTLFANRLDDAIEAAGGESVAVDTARTPTVASYRMPGVSSAVQLIRFDAAGFAVSAGSACSSGSLRPSHVLQAMNYPHKDEVIRVSIGHETREAELDAFLGAWLAIAETAKAA